MALPDTQLVDASRYECLGYSWQVNLAWSAVLYVGSLRRVESIQGA